MKYSELAASRSDHGVRVTELEAALVQSLKSTPESCPTLEIGFREGGSTILTLGLMLEMGQKREMVTVDLEASMNDEVARLMDYSGIHHKNYSTSQENFVREKAGICTWGWVYFDADHNQDTVARDMRLIAPHLAEGCILAVDDVDQWTDIPDFSDAGLKLLPEMTYYEPDRSPKPHFMAWVKQSNSGT